MGRAWRAIYGGWMAFAHLLGRVQTFLILSFIYFVVMALTAPLYRLISVDPLDRRLRDRPSIWTRKAQTNKSLEEARRTF